ncbi:TM2 domain-containing protein [Paenibacillus sp. CAA11]|nr:TM2 domain-containing protein [Paenibacillus sp. CAA11]
MLKRDLSTNELLILNSELRHAEKSQALAYLMLVGGHLGVHRFYLRRIGTAIAQLVLFFTVIFSYIFMLISIGLGAEALFFIFIVLLIGSAATLTIWVIVDLFLIPGMVKDWNTRVEQQIMEQIIRQRSYMSQGLDHPL